MNLLAVARQGRWGGAAVIVNGEVAGCVEAPLNASDGGFPGDAARECLAAARIEADSLARVIWCGDAEGGAPRARGAEGLKVPSFVQRGLKRLGADLPEQGLRQRAPLESLAAATYFASPFPSATLLLIPGGAAGGVHLWKGEGADLHPHGYLPAAHSPARLLDVFGHYLGLNEGRFAYDLAYLAAYGAPRYSQTLLDRTVEVRGDGSFALKGGVGHEELDAPLVAEQLRREAGLPEIVPGHFDETAADLARSVVAVLRYLLGHLVIQSRRRLGTEAVCLGGDWIWDIARHRLLPEDRLFQQAWVHPQHGPAARALGAALAEAGDWEVGGRQSAGTERPAVGFPFLGAAHSDLSIETFLSESAIPYDAIAPDRLPGRVAELVRHRHRVGWFQGREESGTGVSGHRLRLNMIDRTMLERLGDPRRTGLIPRPLTVCVLAEQAHQYFEQEPVPPFHSADAAGARLCYWRRDTGGESAPNEEGTPFVRRPLQGRGPALVLRVHPLRDPALYRLLSALQERTHVPLMAADALADESGMAARTPADAYDLLRANRLEALVLGNAIVLASGDLPDLGTAHALPANAWQQWSQSIGKQGRETEAKVRRFAETATRRARAQIESWRGSTSEPGDTFWRSYSG